MSEEKPPVYPSNAHADREKAIEPPEIEKDPKKIESIVSAPAVQKKPSVGKRILQAFTGEDVHTVGGYVLYEVLIPAAKNTIQDVVTTAIERLMFGDARPRSSSGVRGGGYVPYNKISSSRSSTRYESDWKKPGEGRTMSRQARASHNFDEIIIPDRDEAENVRDRLKELIDRYDVASVSQLYALVGVTGSYADDKYGWDRNDAREFGIRRVREGYLLDLPRPTEL